MYWVHKFANATYVGSVSFDDATKALAYADGFRDCADFVASPVAAYANVGDDIALMATCEPALQVARAEAAVINSEPTI